MRTSFIIVFVVIVLLIVARLLWGVSQIFSEAANNEKLDSAVNLKKAPDEHLKLFKIKDKLVWDRSDQSKRRNVISEFYYDNKYLVQVYKIDSISNLSIDKTVNESFRDTSSSMDVVYESPISYTEFDIRYLEGSKVKMSQIHLTLYGDSTQVMKKNDSVAYYYAKFKNFSISHSINAPVDIYGEFSNERYKGHQAPLELLFLKRNHDLYFIALGSEKEHTPVGRNLLYDLVCGKQEL